MSLDVLYVTDAEALGGAELYLETLLRHACATGLRAGLALLMANEPEYVAAKFAIAKVGAVAVPIN